MHRKNMLLRRLLAMALGYGAIWFFQNVWPMRRVKMKRPLARRLSYALAKIR